ncbi:MAG: ComEC/Rec2 family competence protein, partial [Oscillospiraceae bacterium]|nr:ComEC/Rec2 family competence protein [Oscillospiraceae bacterium]
MSTVMPKLRRYRVQIIAAAICLAACVAWKFGYDAIFMTPAIQLDGVKTVLAVRTLNYSQLYDRASITPVSVILPGADVRADLYLYYDTEQNEPVVYAPGTTLSVAAKGKLASNDELDRTYSGVFLYLYADSDGVEYAEPGGFSAVYIPRYISLKMRSIADSIFPPDAAPFLKALLSGDRFDWNADSLAKSAFSIAGISHIVAVSGMHLGYLTALLGLVLGKGKLRVFVGIPVILLFALISGATASIIRASVMSVAFLIATLISRDYKPWRSLLLSLLILNV